MHIGLTLSNRGVLLGITTPPQMLDLAEMADRSGLFRSVWVGDSLLGKPRMESVSLLAAVAGRTRQVRLGTACMASFVLRDPVLLAYQWASLDLLSGGRTVLVGCTGIVEQEGARIEGELYGLQPRDRVARLIEWIALIKKLWTEDNVTFEGKQYRCSGITIDPRPAAKPRPPIWIANNAREDKPFSEWTSEDFALIERTHRRCARHADGWQTSAWDPKDLEFRINDTLKKVREQGRDPATFERHLYHNINVNEDREAALAESQRFLEQYYVPTKFPRTFVDQWVATGSPRQCAERLKQLRDLGFSEVTLRLTSWDQPVSIGDWSRRFCRWRELATMIESAVRLHVEPLRALVDEPWNIHLDGLAAGQHVVVRAAQSDDFARTWRSHAAFQADSAGRIDLSTQAPTSGSYSTVDPMGLIWSMALDRDEPNQAGFFRKEPTPISVDLTVDIDGRVASRQSVERLLVADGVERRVVRDDGLAGTLFVPPGDGPHPSVIVVSGSGGGLSEPAAALYASHGYAGFALAYFNYEHLPPELVDIPLEYFETAIAWLKQQPRLDADRIAVSGTSRGGELALLLGATFNAITAVIAYVPSGIVFGGIGRDGVRGARPAWTYRGQPVAFLQPRPDRLSPEPPPPGPDEAVRLTPYFLRNMEDEEAVASVQIPVEQINGPLLMISGKDDAMWPSTPLAEIAMQRLRTKHFPHPYRHVAYEGAGHMIGTPYSPSTIVASRHPLTGGLNAYGGTAQAYAAAREDSWRQILRMLDDTFRNE